MNINSVTYTPNSNLYQTSQKDILDKSSTIQQFSSLASKVKSVVLVALPFSTLSAFQALPVSMALFAYFKSSNSNIQQLPSKVKSVALALFVSLTSQAGAMPIDRNMDAGQAFNQVFREKGNETFKSLNIDASNTTAKDFISNKTNQTYIAWTRQHIQGILSQESLVVGNQTLTEFAIESFTHFLSITAAKDFISKLANKTLGSFGISTSNITAGDFISNKTNQTMSQLTNQAVEGWSRAVNNQTLKEFATENFTDFLSITAAKDSFSKLLNDSLNSLGIGTSNTTVADFIADKTNKTNE